jgi:CelD/BcsL family acetyltransferase involved in cellulose biosynthesis
MTARESTTFRHTDPADAGEWYADTLRDDGALSGLAAEWEDLYQRCTAATAFLSHAWLESWWRSYGRPGRLVLVLVRRADQLVAAAPLIRRRHWGLPVLTPVGAGVSDFSDVLIDDSCAGEAGRRLAQELAAQARWHTIDFPEVPQRAAAWHVVDAWPLATWRLSSSTCLELPARPMEQLIETLPTHTAQTRRKKRRKIEAAGIETRLAGINEAAGAIAALLRLHSQQWRGRGMNPEHGRSRFAAHLTRSVPTMVERGQALLVEYRLDGDVVAVELLVDGHDVMGAYLYGFRPDLRQRVDVTQLLLGKDLELAERLGRQTLSLLRGNEPYKRRWRPREASNQRVLLASPGYLPSALYATGVRARHHLTDTVKTRLPQVERAVRSIRSCLPFSM